MNKCLDVIMPMQDHRSIIHAYLACTNYCAYRQTSFRLGTPIRAFSALSSFLFSLPTVKNHYDNLILSGESRVSFVVSYIREEPRTV